MTYQQPIRHPSAADALLIDIARRIQLSPTKHSEAERHFIALCKHVDRQGSPLEGKVIACYPGGSFATGTAIASRVSKNQHDVDVVMEIDTDPYSSPRTMLGLLFEAINGEEGSRYHGRVELNSRCITVRYDDGVKVDLMPIARLPLQGDKAGNLFHWKRSTDEEYHKPVNPWGFADHFNSRVQFDPAFAMAFDARRQLEEGTALAKALTEPLPEHTPLSEKSPRVVALQLLKRNRDVRYRSRAGRKPPSVVLAALALETTPAGTGLLDELERIANHIRFRLVSSTSAYQMLEVRNPAYRPDVFTDRWPKDIDAQKLYASDLDQLIKQLNRLRDDSLGVEQMKTILEGLFGETAADYAIGQFLDAARREAAAGIMRIGSAGRVLTGAPAIIGAATSAAARASTNMGGGCIPD